MAKDLYHETVKLTLIKDGWRVTHDPFIIEFEGLRVFADLGAEKTLSIKYNKKIAIEVKVFGGKSKISEFEKALGQYDLYKLFLAELDPQRQLFLAVFEKIYEEFFDQPAILFAVKKKQLKMIIFNQDSEEIVQWIN